MTNKPAKKVNGVTQLDEQMENMRLTVIDLELKARYWKAQADIREQTLKFESMEELYNVYIEKQKKLAEELKAEQEKQLEILQTKLAEAAAKESKIEA